MADHFEEQLNSIHIIDDCSHWISYGGLLALSASLFYVFHWISQPLNWTRDISDIGYNHVRESYRNKQSAKEAINRLKRLRKIGEKMPPPFPNGWYSVAESRNVKTDEVKSVDVLGQNLLIFRTKNGEANVFDAYCPHLGANLAIGGIVKGDCITCPFHRWSFRGSDGQCVNVPYSTAETFPKSSKLKKWISNEIDGAIFIWYHAENCDPWQLPIVNEVTSGEWTYRGRNEFIINCHIQEIPENGPDVAHLNAVHSANMLAGNDLRFTNALWASFGVHTWNAKWTPCTEQEKSHTATIALKHAIKLFDIIDVSTMDVTINQVGPGYVQLLFQTSFGPFAVLQTVVPIEPLLQKVIHRFYFPRNLPMFLFSKFTIWGQSVMFERDIMVWNHKKYIDNPCLLKEDRMIKEYRKWFSHFYSENSIRFPTSQDTLEW